MTIDVKKLALEAGAELERRTFGQGEFGVYWRFVDAEPYSPRQRELERFAALVLEEAARKCDERAIDYAGLTEEQHASQRCAAIVRALKPTYTPSEP